MPPMDPGSCLPRNLDEHDAIASVGVSLEPVEPATALPVFINMREIAHRVRDRLRRWRGKQVKPSL